ncbi:MAG: hypothetical protein GX117_03655 [Candidatus Hydrogenedentes bacterium]|nr:hypothetical protein [Candidatus Hydrogenedentota bacterium]
MSGMTVEFPVHIERFQHGRKRLLKGNASPGTEDSKPGRVPRLSRLMALAIHFEVLLASGEVTDMADLARLGHVSRARITQIMNLRLLAPDIQENLLFLPYTEDARDELKYADIRPLTVEHDWTEQRRMLRILTYTSVF